MTSDEFRALASKMPGALEGAHMRHPDFRIGGKVFATLGYPEDGCAMVVLAPEEQAVLMSSFPAIFSPAKGAWGRAGSTIVRLSVASEAVARDALELASRRALEKAGSARSARATKR